MKFAILALVAAIVGASALSGAASAQNRAAVTGEQLQDILEAAGLAAEVIEDAKTGAPVANVETQTVQYWVRALDCSGAPKACSTLVFFANFDLGRAVTADDYKVVNHFNDSQVFGRAYLLPGRNEVGVDYIIELSGGVSEQNIAGNIGRWADVINAFIAHFSAGAATS